MKALKIAAVAALVLGGFAPGSAHAWDEVYVRTYSRPVYYTPATVYVRPARVYVRPAPVVYYSEPVTYVRSYSRTYVSRPYFTRTTIIRRW